MEAQEIIKEDMRYIGLKDGTSAEDNLIIFDTNAPKRELEELERISCEIYKNGGTERDIPVWANQLIVKGYLFKYINSHKNAREDETAKEWQEELYPDIEIYTIENHPKLEEATED